MKKIESGIFLILITTVLMLAACGKITWPLKVKVELKNFDQQVSRKCLFQLVPNKSTLQDLCIHQRP